jgi:glycyl-tRNA synthetase beta chain
MGELLLELLSEEIPARMQRRAVDDLSGLLRDRLAAAEIPADGLRRYVTPRRLAIIAEGIPTKQPDRVEERRGPRVGAPQTAIDGFLRSLGFAAIDECEIRDTARGEFYFAVVKQPGRPSAAVLSELIKTAIAELPWPKSMRYPASDLRWVRPLTSVLCLFDGKIVPVALDRVPVGRTTRGHRFLAPREISVEDAAEYLEKLRQARVVLDQDQREQTVRRGLEAAALSEGLSLKPDPALLEEVTGLVEFPVVLMGAIDSDFMMLPAELLATAMRTHQKYFSCLRSDGALAPRFLFVANNLASDGGKTIVAGNERVLRARLADARFFWEQDRRVRLESRVETLADRVFHAKLGSVRDKVARMERLVTFLAPYVRDADVVLSQRAARLAKADLSTGMVGEFPELQGIMGQYYAQHDREDPAVSQAIADHYRPLGPNDACPTAPQSIVVALADKIDTLVAFFAISLLSLDDHDNRPTLGDDDYRPTGSRDPYSLRRAALGTIRIIVENRIRLSLKDALTNAAEIFYRERSAQKWEDRIQPLYAELMTFIVDRLKVHLRDRGVRHDLIAAAFAQVIEAESDLVRLLNRVGALAGFLASEDGVGLLTAYRRASNIVAIEERRDNRRYDHDIDRALLKQPEEFALAGDLDLARGGVERSLHREEFEVAMGHVAALRRPVDEFFERVTVNIDDPRLRENRLRLLAGIRTTMNQVADFSQIEG